MGITTIHVLIINIIINFVFTEHTFQINDYKYNDDTCINDQHGY